MPRSVAGLAEPAYVKLVFLAVAVLVVPFDTAFVPTAVAYFGPCEPSGLHCVIYRFIGSSFLRIPSPVAPVLFRFCRFAPIGRVVAPSLFCFYRFTFIGRVVAPFRRPT